jgi:ABC-type uncharacterized transport system YnjBCD permease subunit
VRKYKPDRHFVLVKNVLLKLRHLDLSLIIHKAYQEVQKKVSKIVLIFKSSKSQIIFYNSRFPLLLRFRSAFHCGYSGIIDIQDGLFFVLTRARTFKKLGSGAR